MTHTCSLTTTLEQYTDMQVKPCAITTTKKLCLSLAPLSYMFQTQLYVKSIVTILRITCDWYTRRCLKHIVKRARERRREVIPIALASKGKGVSLNYTLG